jgi:hypothetical protein
LNRSTSFLPFVLNAFVIAAVTALLFATGAPIQVYKGFVGGHVVLVTAFVIFIFIAAFFSSYRNSFSPWKRALADSTMFIGNTFEVLIGIGWPAFGASYALYYWLST